MSRYVTVQTKLRDLSIVRRVLDELKAHYEESERESRKCLDITRGGVEVNLTENDSGFLVARGYEENVATQKDLLNTIQRAYARHKVVDLAKKAGFSITSEKTSLRNEIVLEVTKW